MICYLPSYDLQVVQHVELVDPIVWAHHWSWSQQLESTSHKSTSLQMYFHCTLFDTVHCTIQGKLSDFMPFHNRLRTKQVQMHLIYVLIWGQTMLLCILLPDRVQKTRSKEIIMSAETHKTIFTDIINFCNSAIIVSILVQTIYSTSWQKGFVRARLQNEQQTVQSCLHLFHSCTFSSISPKYPLLLGCPRSWNCSDQEAC